MAEVTEKYHITAENIYNWDEKGFMIGRSSVRRRIVTKEAYNSGRIRHFQQDGNREWISLLACVCADGTTLPPALIYQGASNDLQSSWLEDLNEEDNAHFTSQEHGWTCDALGLSWLRLFDKYTRSKGSRRRLLILDGHSSHLNWAFVCLADSLRILLLILPPHTTHRLQPLDLGLFRPLATAYTKRLDAYTHGGLGWVSMTKRMFWPLFRDAWQESFTVKNIIKAFEKAKIWPLQTEISVAELEKPSPKPSTPSKLPSLPIATPMTCRAVRRLCKASPTLQKVAILERAVLRLATRFEIQTHENRGLRAAIMIEKKRRNHRKRLNLLGEETNAAPQFFSPQKVLSARAYQESKEAAEQEEKRQKALRKEEAACQRQKLQAEKQEAAVQRQLRREANKEAKAAEKVQQTQEREAKRRQKEQDKQEKAAVVLQRKKERELQKQLAAATKTTAASKPRPRRASIGPPKPRKKPVNPITKAIHAAAVSQGRSPRSIDTASSTAAGAIDVAAVEAPITNQRGRVVILPQRFRE